MGGGPIHFPNWDNPPSGRKIVSICAIWSTNSHNREGHQPNSRGLYTHYKDSFIKGGMTIPNIRSWSTLAHIIGASGIQYSF